MAGMKKTAWFISVILFVFAAAMFGGAWYFSNVLLHPPPHVCKTSHYVYCKDPSQVNLKFEDVSYRASDGIRLSAWYIAGRAGAPGILIQHGRGATRREGMRYASALHKAGFNLLLADARNCGKSEKTFNSMGYHERKDIHAGIDYLLKERKLPMAGVFGFSMGASTAIMAMAADKRIKAGIFNSGFADFRSVIVEGAKADFGLPEYPLLPLVTMLYESRGNLNTSDPTPVKAIASISPRPVFIIHGTADKRVDYHHGRDLFRAAREPKQFWSVEGGEHTKAWQKNRPLAEKKVVEFMRKHLK